MSKQATMFFTNITDLDCAMLEDNEIVGRSFRIKAKVTGPVEQEEQVVIDFSKCKSEMKRLIDDADVGFDHKFLYDTNSEVVISDFILNSETRTNISGKTFEATGDSHMFQLMPKTGLTATESLRLSIEDLLEEGLSNLVDIDRSKLKVEVTLGILSVFTSDALIFSYVHGLKNSSSFGCQNIIHGHSSYIEAFDRDGKRILVRDLVKATGIKYGKSYVITTSDNAEVKLDSDQVNISYNSKSRGKFSMTTGQPIWILDHPDTTVENLAYYLAVENFYALMALGVAELYVSEGLSKGAVVKLDDIDKRLTLLGNKKSVRTGRY